MNIRIVLTLLSAVLAFAPACSKNGDVTSAVASNSPAVLSAPTPVPEAGFVYTANERGNSISVIDLGTGQVSNIATRISPHNVQVSRDGRLLLAVGEVEEETETGPGSPPDSSGKKDEMDGMEAGVLLIFDTATMDAGTATHIAVGPEPAHVVIDAQGKFAYVTNAMGNNLSMVDQQQKKVITTIATGKMPHGLRPSPDGRELYVADVQSNGVSVIDTAQSREVTRIAVGKAPVQIAFTPDGRFAYVSLRDENSVAVIDTAQRKKIASVAVGRNPIQLFVTPDARHVYVANQGSETNPDNTVSVIDTRNNQVVATIVTGAGAHGVMISDDGRRAFISNIVDDSVSVIDTATQQVLRTIKVGKGPNGITYRNGER